MISLKNILHRLYKEKRLAHCYIIKERQNSDQELSQFVIEWLKECLYPHQTAISDSTLFSNGSVLYLCPETKSKSLHDYQTEQFRGFFNFLEYSTQNHRFILIDHAQKLTSTLCNKLLKSLEEPTDHTTIFLIQTQSHEFPATISGRAVTLHIPLPYAHAAVDELFPLNFSHSEDEGDRENQKKLQWFSDNIPVDLPHREKLLECIENKNASYELVSHADSLLEESLVELLIKWERQCLSGFVQKQNFLLLLQNINLSNKFHNPGNERLNTLLQYLCTS